MPKDLRPAIESMTERMVAELRDQRRSDADTPRIRDEAKRAVTEIAKRYERRWGPDGHSQR